MHKQVSGCTVNFGPNFPESPFLELKTEIPPPISENFRFGMTKVYSGIPPPISENFRFGMTKFTLKYPPPPPFWKTSDLGWPKFTPEYSPPHFGKLQIWDDQSLLRNTPPPPGQFKNAESYYMWRLYPTRITTSLWVLYHSEQHVSSQRLIHLVNLVSINQCQGHTGLILEQEINRFNLSETCM